MPEEACSFRQVDEKHVAIEVDTMCWSPKMDLIAIANVQGEVSYICEMDDKFSNLCLLNKMMRNSNFYSFG